MFWTFKLSFEVDILAKVLATFQKTVAFFPTLLVTLAGNNFPLLYHYCLAKNDTFKSSVNLKSKILKSFFYKVLWD